MGMTPEERVWMASLHLDGMAAEWYYVLEWDVSLLPWTCFYHFINMCFILP
jgi:hypothetical protein